MIAEDEDGMNLRRASHDAAQCWRERARACARIARGRDSNALARDARALSDAFADARVDAERAEHDPEVKRRRKAEETNDATRVWGRKPGASAVSAGTSAAFLRWCEECFRDVDDEDIAACVPKIGHDLGEDCDYLVPSLGRHFVHGA